MPWDLTIHHIDVHQGNATVIDARYGDPGQAPALRRTVLINGGSAESAPVVATYLQSIGISRIDIVIVTHFDEYYFGGISAILQKFGQPEYRFLDGATLYDQGWQYPMCEMQTVAAVKGAKLVSDSSYTVYRKAMSSMPSTFRHATSLVNSFEIVNLKTQTGEVLLPAPTTLSISRDPKTFELTDKSRDQTFMPPDRLVGVELMWGNGDLSDWRVESPPRDAPYAPTLTCVAANKWIAQIGPGPRTSRFCSDQAGGLQNEGQLKIIENQKAKGLGLVLKFNNFRYFIAGDLESAQEIGSRNLRSADPAVVPGVMQFLNPSDTASGRVHVVRLADEMSHSFMSGEYVRVPRSTASRSFVSRLRPAAAIVALGSGNRGFLGKDTMPILDGFKKFDDQISKRKEFRFYYPPTVYRPVRRYLSELRYSDNQSYARGPYAHTAGGPSVPGHIRVLVSQEESLRPPEGRQYRIALAVTRAVASIFGDQVPQQVVTSCADDMTLYGSCAVVGKIIGAPFAAVEEAITKAAWVCPWPRPEGTPLETVLAGPDQTAQDLLSAMLGEATVDAMISAVRDPENTYEGRVHDAIAALGGPHAITAATAAATAARLMRGTRGAAADWSTAPWRSWRRPPSPSGAPPSPRP
ncbi:hypothetical protein [Phytohabitans rumicis]|uniref:Metallo-beta-lactamase domain-containing protein n=1 Tax=Phytohabitans rumicis TaxID=1076125 RepID=A0A6V8KXQ1_9ACTN|nr:hypothetical protein [Phytohabitans rumicis]GFJ87468.1 hypothetical protein Prum_011100 [Phytohabitans rumicis]